MTKEEKRIILILIVLTVVVIGILLIWKNNQNKELANQEPESSNIVVEDYVQNLGDGSKLNISEELQKPKTIDGFEIRDIQLKEKEGITTLLATVENKTGKATSDKMIKIEVLDKEGNVITTPRGVIGEMPVGGTVQLNIAISADVSNAYDIRVSNP